MGEKKITNSFAWFFTLITFSAIILYPAWQWYLVAVPVVLFVLTVLPGGSFFEKHTYLPLCLLTFSVIAFYLIKIRNSTYPHFGLPTCCINSLTGTVVYDSSYTQSNGLFLTVSVSKAGSVYGQSATAKGVVNVICKEHSILTSGIRIQVSGRFDGTFFKASSIQVLQRTQLNEIREFLISEIEKRLVGPETSDSSLLSSMLILGRADECAPRIKDLASQCGCIHVLALSGMHLNSVSILFRKIPKRKIRYLCSVITSSIFVFIAGPRPSLIRALLMLIFSFLPTTEKLVVCFVIQSMLFPLSIVNTGCLYSYVAIFALTYVAPMLGRNRFIAKPVLSSASVIFLIAPIELISGKTWQPIAILISPLAGLLIMVSMFAGFLLIIFGRIHFLVAVNDFIYCCIDSFFSYFAEYKEGTWNTYLVFASFIIILLLDSPVRKLILHHRFKNVNKNSIMKI